MVDVVRDAAIEVRKPTMFGELIIMIVYLPILTLEGIEGKLFRPMALTVIFALMGSMVLSLTLMPVLASLILPRHIEEREPLADADRPPHLRPDPAIFDALQGARAGVGGGRGVRRLRDHRAEFGLGVCAATFRGGDRDQRRAAHRHRSRRLDQIQHANGAGGACRVPGRSRARLEPHRHGGDRHRSDGHRADGHVHDA